MALRAILDPVFKFLLVSVRKYRYRTPEDAMQVVSKARHSLGIDDAFRADKTLALALMSTLAMQIRPGNALGHPPLVVFCSNVRYESNFIRNFVGTVTHIKMPEEDKAPSDQDDVIRLGHYQDLTSLKEESLDNILKRLKPKSRALTWGVARANMFTAHSLWGDIWMLYVNGNCHPKLTEDGQQELWAAVYSLWYFLGDKEDERFVELANAAKRHGYFLGKEFRDAGY